MLFEFTADRIYDLFYIYLSLSTVIRIRSSHVCILRETVFLFFFSELVKVYYKSNKVEEHLNMIVTI